MGQFPRVVQALEKLVKLMPDNPEAWFDLGGFQAVLNQTPQAVESLRIALQLNAQRLQRDPKAANLLNVALSDPRFETIRKTPEFQQLLSEQKPVPQ